MNDLVSKDVGGRSMVADMVSNIIRAAQDQNVDAEKMKTLMAMAKELRQEENEYLFNRAMNDCQMEMRPISADAENPSTRSRYATYGKLDNYLRPIYTKHGFGLSFNTGDSPDPASVRVLCYVSHRDGHSRTYHIDMPADGKGAKGGDVMTRTHATGAGVTYGTRYLLKMIFNVAIGEADDDGNAASAESAAFLAWRESIRSATDLPALKKVGDDLASAKLAANDKKRLRDIYAEAKHSLETDNG